MTVALVALAILGLGLLVRFLTTPASYPPIDLADIDRADLLEFGEGLLAASETWPQNLTDRGVVVRSSLEPFVVRAVRYEVEVEAEFERAVEYVKSMSYCPVPVLESKDKIEEMLHEKNKGGDHHEWIRRSVHVSPPPGSNRDAVVLYVEDRPEARSYRIGFRSVDSIDGANIEPHKGASRFMVNPAIYRVDETAPGTVRIRKVEAVDPQGMVSPLVNNYMISILFFRKYMFDEAKTIRDDLIAGRECMERPPPLS